MKNLNNFNSLFGFALAYYSHFGCAEGTLGRQKQMDLVLRPLMRIFVPHEWPGKDREMGGKAVVTPPRHATRDTQLATHNSQLATRTGGPILA